MIDEIEQFGKKFCVFIKKNCNKYTKIVENTNKNICKKLKFFLNRMSNYIEFYPDFGYN